MNDFTDSIVFITGASSGIGEFCARRFARAGARLMLAARRKDRLQQLAAELRKEHGTETYLVELDVRDKSAVDKMFTRLPEEWRAIDVLVNNAGLSRGLDKISEASLDDWEEMIDTNIKGLLYISRAVVPGMVDRNRGTLINIGSIAGHEVYPGGSVYCATKHAVNAISRSLRMELYDTPIRVCEISPGLVETEFSMVRFRGDTQRAGNIYKGVEPLTGENIADAVFYCAAAPPNVQIAEMIILATAQGAATMVHRRTT